MKKLKQILALVTVAIILVLYATTFVLALMGKNYDKMFTASLTATVVLPTMLYIIIWLRGVLKKHAD